MASRRQGSKLPRGRETDVGTAVVTPVAADIEPVGSEDADDDAATVRVLIDGTDVAVGKESLAGSQEVDCHGRQGDSGRGDFHTGRDERLLLREGLPEGILHHSHLELAIAGRLFALREGLGVVPGLGIEDVVGENLNTSTQVHDAKTWIEKGDESGKSVWRSTKGCELVLGVLGT